MTRIGSMQGRLVPPYGSRIQCFPKDNWELEFTLASQAGLDCIEWIFDGHGVESNPIASAEGIERIRALSGQHGVQVRSICADYFMEEPLLRATVGELTARIEILKGLLGRSSSLGITRIVLPFVDASRIETEEEMDGVVQVLREALRTAEETRIELHLETSLSPRKFAGLLERLPHPLLKANYDSGNSASLGYSPAEEFKAYGSRVGSVHIKDRVLGGGTVPLGTGSADFPALWEALRLVEYPGDFILQVARGESGREVDWARQNRTFVVENLRKAGIGTYALES